MLNVIALADIHVKFVQGVDKDWQYDRYDKFINHIVEECLKEDAILILAGDTLDSSRPTKDELNVFFKLLHALNKHDIFTLLVSGNHCSLKQGSSILDYLGVDKFSNVVYRSTALAEGVTFHLVNHDELGTYKPKLSKQGPNILVSHFRCNYNKFVTEEIDVAKFTEPYDLCIVGDIHDSFRIGDKVYYTNNPINSSFDANPDCSYLKISIDDYSFGVERVKTELPSLISKKVSAEEYDKAKVNDVDFYKIEVEGTPDELRSLKPIRNSILKKIPIIPAVLDLCNAEVEDVKLSVSSEGDEKFISYMTSLGYPNELIGEMMKELRRN